MASKFTFIISLMLSLASGICTVMGIGHIFTSAPIMTMIIAGTIEVGRVILVYDLHHYWKLMPIRKRVPGIIMLLIAMSLSALGVFGFFANAYSAKTKEVVPMELEVKQLEMEIPTILAEIDGNNEQIETIQKMLNSKNMDRAMDKYLERDYISKALSVQKEMRVNITKLLNDNKDLNNKLNSIKQKITDLQINMEKKAPTIAHLKYLAQLLHTTNDKAVIIFIVMIMMVFDTLAMYLMMISDWTTSMKPVVYHPYTSDSKLKDFRDNLTVKLNNYKKDDKKEVDTSIITKKFNRDSFNYATVSSVMDLINKDENILDNKDFIESILDTPLLYEQLIKNLGEDDIVVKKIKNYIKENNY